MEGRSSIQFEIWFWCCWWMNSCIFNKLNYIFECFLCFPYVTIFWWVFRRWKGIFWFDGWYFHIKGVNFFVWSDFISSMLISIVVSVSNLAASIFRKFYCSYLSFKYALQRMWEFYKYASSVQRVFMTIVCFFFYHCVTFWEAQCFWFEADQFISNLLQLFILFI